MRDDGSRSLDDLETMICQFLKEVLDLDEVRPDDDFFELGGDSLTAETLSGKIFSATGHEFQMAWLLKSGTPRLIAERLLSSAPASRNAGRPPIFAVHGRQGFMLPQPDFIKSLADGQELRMFELPGIRGGAPPLSRIEEIAAAYNAEIEEAYPVGPVLLAGFCMGSLIAVEMAAQLVERGREVGQLVLIDPGMPETTVTRLRLGSSAEREEWKRQGEWRSVRRISSIVNRASPSPEGISTRHIRRFWEMYFLGTLYRGRLSKRRRKSVDYQFNLRARAKLLAAFWTYRPRTFSGPSAILATSLRASMVTPIWKAFLPNCSVHVVGETHVDVVQGAGGETPRKLQELCDQALASRQLNAA
jgi:pimeloyl-ACP methyl ester carboxylesterase